MSIDWQDTNIKDNKMIHQDYMFRKEAKAKRNWAEIIMTGFILILVLSAIVALPASIFINANTYYFQKNLVKRMANIELMQMDIMNNNYRHTVECGK